MYYNPYVSKIYDKHTSGFLGELTGGECLPVQHCPASYVDGPIGLSFYFLYSVLVTSNISGSALGLHSKSVLEHLVEGPRGKCRFCIASLCMWVRVQCSLGL